MARRRHSPAAAAAPQSRRAGASVRRRGGAGGERPDAARRKRAGRGAKVTLYRAPLAAAGGARRLAPPRQGAAAMARRSAATQPGMGGARARARARGGARRERGWRLGPLVWPLGPLGSAAALACRRNPAFGGGCGLAPRGPAEGERGGWSRSLRPGGAAVRGVEGGKPAQARGLKSWGVLRWGERGVTPPQRVIGVERPERGGLRAWWRRAEQRPAPEDVPVWLELLRLSGAGTVTRSRNEPETPPVPAGTDRRRGCLQEHPKSSKSPYYLISLFCMMSKFTPK